jgi:hypothetical protein
MLPATGHGWTVLPGVVQAAIIIRAKLKDLLCLKVSAMLLLVMICIAAGILQIEA